jgi:hypothetical protein
VAGFDHFLGNIGRLNEARFTRYYSNKCKKEYTGCLVITYENPNERLVKVLHLLKKENIDAGLVIT